MPDYVMTSKAGLYIENFKTLLANVLAFRTFSDSADVAEAKTHIYRLASAVFTRPGVLIVFGEDLVSESDSVGANGNEFGPWLDGSMIGIFEKNVSATYPSDSSSDKENATAEFADEILLIQDGVEAISGSDGIMEIQGFESLTTIPARATKEQGYPIEFYQWAVKFDLP